MTRLQDRHPGFEEILLLADEESSAQASRWAKQHLASCWKCRGFLQEAQDTVRELARYHDKVLAPSVQPPPKQWQDLRAAMMTAGERPRPWVSERWRLGRMALAACLLVSLGLAALGVFQAVRQPKQPTAVPALRPKLENVTPPKPILTERPEPLPPTVGSVAPARVSTGPSDSDLEVRAFAAVHRIGADLGDPIEIAASDGRVRVVGTGLGAEREAEIRSALASVENVHVDFEPAADVAPGGASVQVSVDASRSPWEPQLLSVLGGRASLERFASQLLDESDAVMTRVHAMRKLSEQFPAEKRSQLHEPERATLAAMVADHRAALNQRAMAVERMLAQIRDAVAIPAVIARPGDLLEAAQRLDRVLSVIFGGASTKLTAADLPGELGQAAADLKLRIGETR